MATHDDKKGRKRPRRAGLPLHVYIPPRTRRTLDAYVGQSDPRVSQGAIVDLALRRFFESEEFPLVDAPPHSR